MNGLFSHLHDHNHFQAIKETYGQWIAQGCSTIHLSFKHHESKRGQPYCRPRENGRTSQYHIYDLHPRECCQKGEYHSIPMQVLRLFGIDAGKLSGLQFLGSGRLTRCSVAEVFRFQACAETKCAVPLVGSRSSPQM